MTRVVLDASVALKWFFQARDDEADVDQALAILTGVDNEDLQLIEPPHFIAEVAAVLAREKPQDARDDLLDLMNIQRETYDTPELHATALDLAMRYRHHLFDTLYHAVALHIPDCTLITADRRYYEKAGAEGQISLLSAWARTLP